jgi:transcription elongation factor SPT5
VLDAIRGLRTIYSGKGAKLVPLKERPAAISVNRQAKAAIERDSWVRVRGGLYKDDLAKVCGC